ncbi:unnamed protein product [Effrenium voratum]|nr:unnamed protein product [Effrenium voratum]
MGFRSRSFERESRETKLRVSELKFELMKQFMDCKKHDRHRRFNIFGLPPLASVLTMNKSYFFQEKAQLGGDLRIDAVRPLPEARSPDRARRRQSHLPEAKSKEAPFAPDMASLFVGKEEKEKEAKRHEREVRERQAPSFTPRRVATALRLSESLASSHPVRF